MSRNLNLNEGVSILIVEDNPDHATLARAAFKEHSDWHVEVATTIAGAYALMTSQSFNVVIIDNVLPDGFGVDLLDWVRDDCAAILMTAQGSEAIAAESFRMGAANYVIKDTLFRHNLRDAVEQALARRRPAEAVADH